MSTTKAAIWARVSTTEQDPANQVAQLREWAQQRRLNVVRVYQVEESAFQGKHQKALSQVYDDARLGRFHVLLVWALDRLSREGPLATLETVHRLGHYGVRVLSLQEPWTEAAGELRDLLLAISGWVARIESQRRSERTKAGLTKARAQGKRLGRPVGAKDRRKRSRRGYFARWAE
jgi:DNA invertase Pin-like site-specific DNA recombinase